ncbi:MAG: DUF3667 domain-containing protein [Erythrobacter sp.]
MSDITDGIGGAVEGALAGRAVEPNHGKVPSSEPSSSAEDGDCLNCGSELIGAHCHQCGQRRYIHRSLAAIGHDIIHGVLHLDGKLWRTMPMLAWRPGHLTRRYIDGERAKFVSPMAMFLFSVFMMFAVFQVVGISTPSTLTTDGQTNAVLSDVQEQAQLQQVELEEQIAALPEGSADRLALEETLSEAEEALAGVEALQNVDLAGGNDLEAGETGVEWIDENFIKKWRENPGLMLYKLQNNAYKFSWLLIPISVPFVWLLFAWKRRFKAYDHAIFVTYSLAFMSTLFIVVSVAGALGAATGWLVAASLLIPPFHIYRQLKGAYELSRLSAIWRTLLMNFMIGLLVVPIFFWILLLLGAL